jgi:hypothetical protein
MFKVDVWRHPAFVKAVALALFTLVAARDAVAQIITPIDGLSSVRTDVAALNDQNVVTGHYFTNFDGPFGFRYTPADGMNALPKPVGTLYSEPYAISENGVIVGQAYGTAINSSKLMKVTGSTAVGITPPTGFFGAAGYSVNNAGTTVGMLFATGGNSRPFRHTGRRH